MPDRYAILEELRLTPVWRLRARVAEAGVITATESSVPAAASDAATAPSASAPAVTSSAATAPSADSPPPARSDRVARIATLSWNEFAGDVAACTACGLCKTRQRAVPGVGDPHAQWLFVGEAPGAEEDSKGEPFVGEAGRLLDNMLAALAMKRGKNVYIANVLKCRPPGNRTPTPLESESCMPYLDRQIALIEPMLIVALGKSAASTLLNVDASIASLRGRVHRYRGVPLIVTYHPAYLLRNLPDKAKAWEDLCFARATMRAMQVGGDLQSPAVAPK